MIDQPSGSYKTFMYTKPVVELSIQLYRKVFDDFVHIEKFLMLLEKLFVSLLKCDGLFEDP